MLDNNLVELLDDFRKEIDNVIIILKNKFQDNYYNKKEYLFKGLKNKYMLCHENIYNIYDNINLINIKNSLEKIDSNLNIFWDNEFDPPNINSFESLIPINLDSSNNSNSFFEDYDSFLNKNVEKEKINNALIRCFLCKKNAPKYCLYCDNIICEKCFNIKKNEDDIKKFKLIKNNKSGNEDYNNKFIFLISVCNIIKKIFLMINSIYTATKNKNKENTSNSGNPLEKIKFPHLEDINNFDSILNFLEKINQIFNNLELTSVNIDEFNINNMEKSLLNTINNIIEDNILENYKYILKKLDLDFYLDDESFYIE